MKKIEIPAAYIIAAIVLIAMVGLVIWQIILPDTNPLTVGSILASGGLIASFIVTTHEISVSSRPFAAASLPLGTTCIWLGLVILGTSIWIAIAEHTFTPAIVGGIVSVLLALGGIKTISD
ncbi:MAG: hypothetical protein IJ830_03060 [Alphaproteobacteria bacterium]|jgi:hypothetical protein|nr:hypothetical protein [Alphaproteobacteria bacterium]